MFDGFWESISKYNTPQLVFALVVIAILVLAWAIRHLLASGTDKLAAQQNERSEAIEVLERQIERADEKAEKQEQRIKALEEDRARDARYDQDYRHALNNLAQLSLGHLDVARMLLVHIEDTWAEMPEETKFEIKAVPTAKSLIEKYPLPKREH